MPSIQRTELLPVIAALTLLAAAPAPARRSCPECGPTRTPPAVADHKRSRSPPRLPDQTDDYNRWRYDDPRFERGM